MKWFFRIFLLIIIIGGVLYKGHIYVAPDNYSILKTKNFGISNNIYKPGFYWNWQKFISLKPETIILPKGNFDIPIEKQINLSIIPDNKKLLQLHGYITASLSEEMLVDMEKKYGFEVLKTRIVNDTMTGLEQVLLDKVLNIGTLSRDSIFKKLQVLENKFKAELNESYSEYGFSVIKLKISASQIPVDIAMINKLNNVYLENQIDLVRKKGKIDIEKELSIYKAKANLAEWEVYSDFLKENPIILKYLYITELTKKAGDINIMVQDEDLHSEVPENFNNFKNEK